MLGGEFIAADGCKLRSNASKEWSGKFADLEKKMGSRGKEIQSNITDNESARIMGAHGIIQGYNGLAMSDSKNQVIIHAEACGGVNES